MAGLAATLGTLALLAVSPALPVAHGQGFIELTPELDARAASLYAGIMCPICDGQLVRVLKKFMNLILYLVK